jgi:hypothetical protein
MLERLTIAARRLSQTVELRHQFWDSIRQALFGPGTAGTDSARQSARASALVVWLLGTRPALARLQSSRHSLATRVPRLA